MPDCFALTQNNKEEEKLPVYNRQRTW